MKRIEFVFLTVILMSACQPDGPYTVNVGYEGNETLELSEIPHGMLELGDRLEDPYTVTNMTRALASLYPTKAGEIELSPTDLYVRFRPKNQDEYDMLENCCPNLLDHPVDFEIRKEGDYYHDPEIPDDQLTWQYAVIEKDAPFPTGIEYEILDKCYIAEHDIVTRAGDNGIDWDEVERESYRLTGNGDMLVPATKSSAYPSGRITVLDESYDSEPVGVKGVTVSCNTFVKFSHAFTDEEGYYEMSKSFTRNPRYRLLFKNIKGFGIGFNLIFVPASFSTLGENSPEGVSCSIDKSSNRALFCRSVVNNAAYDYFEGCEGNGESIRTPPANLRFWLFQLLDASSAVMLQQGAVIDRSLIGDFLGDYAPLLKMFLPDITLGLKGAEDYATIYGRAVHELAHASHYMVVGNEYWDEFIKFILVSFVTSGWQTYGVGTEDGHEYCEVAEMWAYYLQTKVYRERYPEQARSFGTSFWFHPQVFTYLDERGLNKFKLFKALSSDVHDVETLEARLLSLYPECKTVIKQAFDRY